MKILAAGIFFGLCSFLLIEVLKIGKFLSDRLKIWKPLKGLVGGTVLAALAIVSSTGYLGLGLDTIEQTLQGGNIPWYSFLMKMAFTSITLNFGGSGGIVTPIFFVGASSGAFFAGIMGLDIATFSAIGLVSLLAGAANTPIAASIMAVEIFGPAVAPYAAVASIISFLMTGHRSVYPSQVLSVVKSSSIQAEVGQEMEFIETSFHRRNKSVTGIISNITDKIKSRRSGKK